MTVNRLQVRVRGTDDDRAVAQFAGDMATCGWNIVSACVGSGPSGTIHLLAEPPDDGDVGATPDRLPAGVEIVPDSVSLPMLARTGRSPPTLMVTGADRRGLLADIARAVTRLGVRVRALEATTRGDLFLVFIDGARPRGVSWTTIVDGIAVQGQVLGFECRLVGQPAGTSWFVRVAQQLKTCGYAALEAMAPLLVIAGVAAAIGAAWHGSRSAVAGACIWLAMWPLLLRLARQVQAFPTERGGPRWDPSAPEPARRRFWRW